MRAADISRSAEVFGRSYATKYRKIRRELAEPRSCILTFDGLRVAGSTEKPVEY